MTNTYDDFASKTRSSKIVLCHIEPTQRLSVFTLSSGTIYKKTVSYFIIDVLEDGVSLVNAANATLSSGEWFFDTLTNEVYINATDDLNPNTHKIVVKYRLFFSNRAIELPSDLSSASEVHYEGRLKPISPISKELDDEQIGVVLETSTNVQFENTDGYFEDFYDVLIFENKDIKLYSWSEILPLSEKKLIFDGIVQDKAISITNVRLNCKDFTHKLRLPIVTENFKAVDGDIPERYLFTPKRRLFGKLKQLQCVPVDAVLDGFALTGTVSTSAASTTLLGSGTSFLDELSPGDEVLYFDTNDTKKYSIQSVESNTSATLSDTPAIAFSSIAVKISPARPWRKKNRRWHIAGHKLRAPSELTTSADQPNRFALADVTDFFPGDLIDVGGSAAYIRRISGNNIILEANIGTGTPPIGTTVTKNPVSKAYVNASEVFITRDWTVTNGTSDSLLVLDELAEFNVAPNINIPNTLTFTASSRTVTVSGLDFRTEVRTRDWIRSTDITHTTWYEILEVKENTILLRTAYAGSTISDTAQKKNVPLVNDDAVITVDTMGQERSDTWIRTASDAVKDMLENDSALTNLNTASFVESDADAPFILSYAIPQRIGGSVKPIKSIISDINKSVFGSLVTDSDFNLRYQILTPEKPADLAELKDDDLLGDATIKSKNEVVRKVDVRYQHFTDRFNGESAFSLYEFTNEFVDDLVGSKNEMDLDIYLYNEVDAISIAQRYALYNSLSSSIVTIKGKLNLITKSLNDKIWINLDRLYKRFANQDRRKIGIINKVSHNGSDVTIDINDLGNAFNRVANVSSDTASDFSSATNDEKIMYSYVCDAATLTPDITSDVEIFSNSIG